MLVCHCHCVTDRTIRDAVRAGATSAAKVGSVCGAATGCGGCRDLVEHIVESEREGSSGPKTHLALAPAF
jgi:bacterioferritin-associated ferredoxin